MEDWLIRERMLLGDEAVMRLANTSVAIFGLGGVGGAAVEGLVRVGIGRLILIDYDTISESNLNRQILVVTDNIGQAKTEAAKSRCLAINPNVVIEVMNVFADAENIEKIITEFKPDYMVDAIDTVTSKLCIIETAVKYNIKIVSCMGTGNKLDPSRLMIADISKTSVCPLARVMRRELRNRGINHLNVLYSNEEPVRTGVRLPGSVSFVPPVAGYTLAGWVVRDIIKNLGENNI
jgi:Dinucleotide-utilizing enzymes involved in molybdopterin and thiamine biosynthesis family 1